MYHHEDQAGHPRRRGKQALLHGSYHSTRNSCQGRLISILLSSWCVAQYDPPVIVGDANVVLAKLAKYLKDSGY
jgi:hypothetical protein